VTTSIAEASPWEQRVYDHLVAHVEGESEILHAYQELADGTDSPAIAYLVRMILDDERRHHALLNDLAETIRRSAELSGEPTPIPDMGMFRADRAEILAQTERFIALEDEDNRELERLARDLRNVRNTTLWQLVLHIIQDDNAKHRRILAFIHDRARRSGTG